MTGFAAGQGPLSGPIRFDKAHAAWNTVVTYSEYDSAQVAVDRLSDTGFPVEHLDIVGSDLRLVERVTGRLTTQVRPRSPVPPAAPGSGC